MFLTNRFWVPKGLLCENLFFDLDVFRQKIQLNTIFNVKDMQEKSSFRFKWTQRTVSG